MDAHEPPFALPATEHPPMEPRSEPSLADCIASMTGAVDGMRTRQDAKLSPRASHRIAAPTQRSPRRRRRPSPRNVSPRQPRRVPLAAVSPASMGCASAVGEAPHEVERKPLGRRKPAEPATPPPPSLHSDDTFDDSDGAALRAMAAALAAEAQRCSDNIAGVVRGLERGGPDKTDFVEFGKGGMAPATVATSFTGKHTAVPTAAAAANTAAGTTSNPTTKASAASTAAAAAADASTAATDSISAPTHNHDDTVLVPSLAVQSPNSTDTGDLPLTIDNCSVQGGPLTPVGKTSSSPGMIFVPESHHESHSSNMHAASFPVNNTSPASSINTEQRNRRRRPRPRESPRSTPRTIAVSRIAHYRCTFCNPPNSNQAPIHSS